MKLLLRKDCVVHLRNTLNWSEISGQIEKHCELSRPSFVSTAVSWSEDLFVWFHACDRFLSGLSAVTLQSWWAFISLAVQTINKRLHSRASTQSASPWVALPWADLLYRRPVFSFKFICGGARICLMIKMLVSVFSIITAVERIDGLWHWVCKKKKKKNYDVKSIFSFKRVDKVLTISFDTIHSKM